MRKLLSLLLIVASALCFSGADANPLSHIRGHARGGGGGGGLARSCDGASSVCAQYDQGQVFVTWTDKATGSAGNDWRYWVYRSTSPITSANYSSLQPFATYVLNNSGQLIGGSFDINGGTSFTQTNRQDNSSSNPMAWIRDLTNGGVTQLAYGTGLQAYTSLANENGYFAVAAASCPVGVCPTTPTMTYIGSAGPIAETIAPPQPIQIADSNSRALSGATGKFTGVCTSSSKCPIVMFAMASDSNGGAASYNLYGHYYEWFGQKDEAWQDGMQTPVDILQDNAGFYPSLPHAIKLGNRDTFWTPNGVTGMETLNFGLGLTPNPLVGVANRLYPIKKTQYEREILWIATNLNGDLNSVHGEGTSMGGWWGSLAGIHGGSGVQFASIWMRKPVFRQDRTAPWHYTGATWLSTYPFKATATSVGGTPTTAPYTLGNDPTKVLLPDGTVFGGTGGYADMPSFVMANPGQDLPFIAWGGNKDDVNYCPWGTTCNDATGYVDWSDAINMRNALETAKRGYAVSFSMGHHDTESSGAIDRDWGGADTAIAYGKNMFALNLPYIATGASTINDNMGTNTRNAYGIQDGDVVGIVNGGFRWNVTADTSTTFNFTIQNNLLGRNATIIPTATTTASLDTTVGPSNSVTVDDPTFGGHLLTYFSNIYFEIGGKEIVKICTSAGLGCPSTGISGNTIYFTRTNLGTVPQNHASGETIKQYPVQPTGPNAAPSGGFTTMTASLTPRRAQNFKPVIGAIVHCTFTPFGGSPVTKDATVDANSLWTLDLTTINVGGATVANCGT